MKRVLQSDPFNPQRPMGHCGLNSTVYTAPRRKRREREKELTARPTTCNTAAGGPRPLAEDMT